MIKLRFLLWASLEISFLSYQQKLVSRKPWKNQIACRWHDKRFFNFERYLLLLILAFNLVGCGFHLRGHEPLPPQLHFLYIQTNQPYSLLTKQLKQTFHSVGIIVSPNPNCAPITLQIVSDNFNQSSTGVSTSGQLTSYLLTYTVCYQLLNIQGHPIQPVQTVTTTHTYSIDSNQVLADTNSLPIWQEEMRRDLIYQMLNRLRSPNTVCALSNY